MEIMILLTLSRECVTIKSKIYCDIITLISLEYVSNLISDEKLFNHLPDLPEYMRGCQ